MRLHRIFLAGFVRRWHANPDLAHTVDRIDGHSARVARIILALHPDPTVALLKAALTHDDGEIVTGDVPWGAKQNPDLKSALNVAEFNARNDLWPVDKCTADDHRWINFADRLDAYMWASHHAPHVLHRDGWPEAKDWLQDEANVLACLAPFIITMDSLAEARGPAQ